MKKLIVLCSFLTFAIPFVQMLAAPTHIPTSCGIVYTDTDYWTDEELKNLGDILEDYCDQLDEQV